MKAHTEQPAETVRDNNRKTTDLQIISSQPHRFTWGRIRKFIHVGPYYTFVEYLVHPSPRDFEGAGPGEQPEPYVNFHVYVDGKDQAHSANTLEGALLIAMARKHLDPNTARYMAEAAGKILGLSK